MIPVSIFHRNTFQLWRYFQNCMYLMYRHCTPRVSLDCYYSHITNIFPSSLSNHTRCVSEEETCFAVALYFLSIRANISQRIFSSVTMAVVGTLHNLFPDVLPWRHVFQHLHQRMVNGCMTLFTGWKKKTLSFSYRIILCRSTDGHKQCCSRDRNEEGSYFCLQDNFCYEMKIAQI